MLDGEESKVGGRGRIQPWSFLNDLNPATWPTLQSCCDNEVDACKEKVPLRLTEGKAGY